MDIEEMEQDTAAMSLGAVGATGMTTTTTTMEKEDPENAPSTTMDVVVDEEQTTTSTADTKDTMLDDDGDDDEEQEQEQETTAAGEGNAAAEIMLLKAANLKEEGNRLFKDGQLEKAARSYRRGVASIKKLNQMNTGDDQVKALLCTLYTNLSTVLFKCGKYQHSADVAGRAVAVVDGTASTSAVKPYYRRAVALRKLGDWDGARADLKMALSIDPANADCAKELSTMKKEMESIKSSQKKAYAKAFSGGSLYNDKEEAAERKRQEVAEAKQREEDLKQRRKQQWEDECVSRMAKGEEAITFDAWDKQRQEQETKEREAADAERREEKRRRREERRRQNEGMNHRSTAAGNDSDDDELTPEECKLLRGYKKTSDGRTTSYFTRELSAEEKDLLGSTTPQRLDGNNDVAATANNTSGVVVNNNDNNNAGSGGGVASSKWNQAGTWEEKDTTTYCKQRLEQRLQEASVRTDDYEYSVDITKVESLSGHSSVAIVSGKKRYIFDFEAKLKYTIKHRRNSNEDQDIIAKGVVNLLDISSANDVAHETETQYDAWKKVPSAEHMERAMKLRNDLTGSLIAQIKLFVRDFNDSY